MSRVREGFASTRDSKRAYILNKDKQEKTNECFITPGGNFKRISEIMPPSRVGKPSNFFNLREHLNTIQKQMPSKNKTSISFAVSEDKVARKQFTFNPKIILGDYKRQRA